MSLKLKKIHLTTNAKKVIILCSMVCLLVISAVLNFVLSDKNITPSDSTLELEPTIETFFTSYRADRQTARAEELSYLESVIATANLPKETLAEAQNRKISLMENIEHELIVESLIKAKGFDDAVVTMSENNINVIVSKAELTSEEVAQILNVILEETTYTASDVVVISYAV